MISSLTRYIRGDGGDPGTAGLGVLYALRVGVGMGVGLLAVLQSGEIICLFVIVGVQV